MHVPIIIMYNNYVYVYMHAWPYNMYVYVYMHASTVDTVDACMAS